MTPTYDRRRALSGWAWAGAVAQWMVCAAAVGLAVFGMMLSEVFGSLTDDGRGGSSGFADVRAAAVILLAAGVLCAAAVAVSVFCSRRSMTATVLAQLPPMVGAGYLIVAGWFGFVAIVGLIALGGAALLLTSTASGTRLQSSRH